MKTSLPLLIACTAAAFLNSCAWPTMAYEQFHNTHHPYRMNPAEGQPDSTIVHLQERTTLGYLEFDDQGELWRRPGKQESRNYGWTEKSRTQLSCVIKEIQRQRAKKTIKTVIFIHGWDHSADENDKNLWAFRDSLRQISAVSTQPVMGIYISWRGTLGTHPFDFASREAAAGRVGGASLLTCLRAIRAATNRDGPEDTSTVTAIGHSYGAKVLLAASCNDIATQMGTQIGEGKNGRTKFSPLADTIILANTAETGAVPLQLMNLMRDYKLKYQTSTGYSRDIPLVASITSHDDFATGKLLPIWNNAARNYFGIISKGGKTSNKIQDQSLFNSIGFYGPLRSHTLRPGNDWNGKWPDDIYYKSWKFLLSANIELGSSYATRREGPLKVMLSTNGSIENGDTAVYTVDHVDKAEFDRYGNGAAQNCTPFWNIQVNRFVSSGHSDVWNPNFTSMIVALEAMRNPKGGSRDTPAGSSMKDLPKAAVERKLTPSPKPKLLLVPPQAE